MTAIPSWSPRPRRGELAGYAAVHWLPYLILKGPEGLLSELFVSEAQRGAGVGSRLLAAAVDEGRKRGCARLMLEAVRTRVLASADG